MTETPIGFGIIGSGNMARVYADALATQVTGGRLTAVALGTRADVPGLRVRGRHRSVGREPRRPARRRRRRHRHAAFDPPAAGPRGRRGRQACLPREADGPRRRRVRPDHRRLQACRGPADDRQADPPHGDVDAGQGLRRRGADRRDPVPPADERDARIGLRQRPAELAVRSARGRRLPRLGSPRLRRRALVHRRRAGPHLRRLRQLHRPAPREPDGDGPDPPVEPGDRPDPAVLRDRTVRVRDPAQQPVPDRRHGGLDLLGPRPDRAAHRGARRARVGAAELDAPRLQAT